MLLPNARRAKINLRKLIAYCLNATHPVGRHKARVFRSALGFTSADADLLRDLLLAGMLIHDAVATRQDEFGQRDTVDVPVRTAVGPAVLRSAWIVRRGEDFPRLTTYFVLPN